MKKPTPKLVVRRETLRALAALEFKRVVGGGDAVPLFDTGAVCTFAAPRPPGG
jgi:hypothetical protein